jgi:hypothetical protein
MNNYGNVALILIYEPATSQQGPVPLLRLDNPVLALEVAQSAIAEADARAAEFSRVDEFLGEAEYAEANRLRQVLALLIPGLFQTTSQLTPAVQ